MEGRLWRARRQLAELLGHKRRAQNKLKYFIVLASSETEQNVSFILIVQCFFGPEDCAETDSADADFRES